MANVRVTCTSTLMACTRSHCHSDPLRASICPSGLRAQGLVHEVKGLKKGAPMQVSRDSQESVPQRSCAVYQTGLCCYAEELEQLNVDKGM